MQRFGGRLGSPLARPIGIHGIVPNPLDCPKTFILLEERKHDVQSEFCVVT